MGRPILHHQGYRVHQHWRAFGVAFRIPRQAGSAGSAARNANPRSGSPRPFPYHMAVWRQPRPIHRIRSAAVLLCFRQAGVQALQRRSAAVAHRKVHPAPAIGFLDYRRPDPQINPAVSRRAALADKSTLQQRQSPPPAAVRRRLPDAAVTGGGAVGRVRQRPF